MSNIISKIVVPSTTEATGYALYNIKDSNAIHSSEKGAANGVAELDENGKVPSSQLPAHAEGEVSSIKIGTTEYNPEDGIVTLPEYPTTLPASDVHDWAKAASKPSYTKSEVGLDNVGNFLAVSTEASQGLSETQKSNARSNIGAGTSSFSGSYNDLTDKPTIPSVGNAEVEIQKNGTKVGSFTTNQSGSKVAVNITVPTGTAANKDVPTSGDASTSQVVMGDDSRLTDSRNAKDVYSWAKASSKPAYTASEVGAIPTSAKGAASGVATLDSTGKVPSSQLPSYVDDVLEYDTKSAFPTTGEAGKIYVNKSNDTTWRWSGTAYVQIKGDLVIGTTTGTAADGGTASAHYSNTSNPHSVTKAQVGLGSVVNTGDSATPVSGGTTKFTTGGAYTELAKKVDKVTGKGLSTNDYTTDEKNKLAGIASGAEVNVQSDWNATEGDAFIKNKPTIPAAVTESTVSGWGFTKNTGTITGIKMNGASKGTSGVVDLGTVITAHQDISGKVDNTTTVNGHALSGNVSVTKSDVGLGNVGNFKAVSTVVSQGLSDTEKSNARANIGAGTSSFSGSYNDLTNKPTIPTVNNAKFSVKGAGTEVASTTSNASAASSVDIVAGANVTVTPDATNNKITIAATDTNTWRPLGTGANDACAGNDSRLSNSRPASDVSAWAKASTKPSYTLDEVSDGSSRKLANYLPKSGGTMNDKAVIARSCEDVSINWYQGRVHPIIKTTSYTGYNSILSMKTTNGSWDLGVYIDDTAYLTYITDAGYNARNNTPTCKLAFPKAVDTIATVTQIPTNNNQLTNGAGYITGITSSMVTTALGYTPANSTALENYLPLSGGTLTGVLNTDTNVNVKSFIYFRNYNNSSIAGYVGRKDSSTNDIMLHGNNNYVALSGLGVKLNCNLVNSDASITYIGSDGSSYVGYAMANTGDTNIYGGRILFCNPDGSSVRMFIGTSSGNIGIGTSSPSYKLHVNGQAGATAFVNTSDIRKKDIIENLNLDVEDIANAPIFKFTWLDPDMPEGVNVGTSAQYWQTVLPEIVSEANDDEKTLSMQYGVAGLVSSVALAKKVVEQEETIKAQEARIKALEDAIANIQNMLNK